VPVQALVPETPVEALDERVFHRLAGADELKLDPAQVCPRIKCLPGELRAVVEHDRLRKLAPSSCFSRCASDTPTPPNLRFQR
jgi:hypothetical protein